MIISAIIGIPRPNIVWTDNDHNPNTAGVTSKSYTVDIGAEGASRYVLVGLVDTGTVSNFKIAGVTATQHVSNGAGVYIFGALVPTGTTAVLTWTTALGTNTENIGVWAAYNLQNTTAFATASFSGGATAPLSLNLNTPAGGVGVAISWTASVSPAAPTATWVGLTENFDVRPWRNAYSGGSFESGTAETPRTVNVSWTAPNGSGGAAASFS